MKVKLPKLPAAGKKTGIAAGAIAGVTGAVYGAQRLVASRMRARDDADARRALEAPIYVSHLLDTFDGGRLYVVEAGEGPPIVLAHGVTLSVRTWFHQLEELPKAGFRTIAFDHRGHGQSVLGEAGHSLDNLALDVKTLLESLDLRDAILVGHSLGGVAAQVFAIRYPEIANERLRGLVLLSTLAHTPFGSRSTQTKAKLERIFNRVPDTTRLWAAPNLGLLLARVGFGKDPHPSHVELVRQMMVDCSAQTRLESPRVLVGLDLIEDLKKIEVPTLVIGGTADVLTPPAEVRRLARHIPNARLELIEGAGHMIMLERGEQFDRLLVEFAREVGLHPHP